MSKLFKGLSMSAAATALVAICQERLGGNR